MIGWRRTQNQPTGYDDQAPVMNWDHAVSWGRGVWVSDSVRGRVGQPELKHRTKPETPSPNPLLKILAHDQYYELKVV